MLELQVPATATSCQERAPQELFSSSGFVAQRTWILQGVYSSILFIAFAITQNVYNGKKPTTVLIR